MNEASVAPGYDEFSTRTHFLGLDGLRALAILPVVAHHATTRPPHGFWGKGAVGVDLFFVLSGFLITTLLVRERRRHGRVDLPRFYWRRALRILPLYYLVLGLYALHAWLLPLPAGPRAHFFDNWQWHAGYVANWFVDYSVPHAVPFAFSWSLCIEQQFYLFWPPLLVLLGRSGWAAAAMAGLVVFDSWVVHHLGLTPAALRILGSFSTAIGFGCLLALALAERGTFVMFGWLGARPTALLALTVTLTLLALPVTPYLALCLGLTVLVGSVALSGGGLLGPLLEHPLCRWLGRISYAAYLSHVTALGVVRRLLPEATFVAVFGLGLPLALAFAWFLHVTIERPCMELGRRYAPLSHRGS